MTLARLPPDLVARATMDTPLGPMTGAASPRGIAWLGFGAPPAVAALALQPGHPWLAQLAAELAAYWRDPVARFSVPIDLAGTPFQRAVWQALAALGPGRTGSYGEIAAAVGRPAAVRAVGAAIGANPVSLVLPCHRVIGRDRRLTGYAGGLDRKRALLRHERAAFVDR